jgi:hypothetical protein
MGRRKALRGRQRAVLVLVDNLPGRGPCVHCGRVRELRAGWCFDCVFPPGTDPIADRIRARAKERRPPAR